MKDPIGVIFDIDGVLIDSGDAHWESWSQLAVELGRPPITHEQFAACFGKRSAEIIGEYFNVFDPDKVQALDHRKESIYRDLIRENVPEMPGARTLVETLHREGMRIALGSSAPPENANLVCEALRLTPMLGAVVTGFDVQHGKPDPQVFQIAAERIGLSARRCLVVEDAPSGLEAARRAGMKCIGLTSFHPAHTLIADRVVATLGAITPELIRSLI